jgi:hypothetical protein
MSPTTAIYSCYLMFALAVGGLSYQAFAAETRVEEHALECTHLILRGGSDSCLKALSTEGRAVQALSNALLAR